MVQQLDASKVTWSQIFKYGKLGIQAVPVVMNITQVVLAAQATKEIPEKETQQAILSLEALLEAFGVKIPDAIEIPVANCFSDFADIIFDLANKKAPEDTDVSGFVASVIDILQGLGVQVTDDFENAATKLVTDLYVFVKGLIEKTIITADETTIKPLIADLVDAIETAAGADVPDEMEQNLVDMITGLAEAAIAVATKK